MLDVLATMMMSPTSGNIGPEMSILLSWHATDYDLGTSESSVPDVQVW